ncbi:MAG TPA: dihydrolipoamide acetyltransferase family protein [Solirubrobacteraceae bacterium]|nr:dihydrolipoamide acetyltransferase family protein [Solirubrobacteraceae bacterium]
MPEIVMPRLSDSMEEATIVRWLKQDGDVVAKGEPLAEVETDKATVTFDADADGTLRILAGEGETVPLGGVIATIGGASESRSDSPVPAQPAPAAPSPSAAGRAPEIDNGSDRVKASPLARRIARESQVDLHGLIGSGPGGRIVKADLPKAEPVARGAKGIVTTVEPSRIQVQIAQRMAESKATIPDFTLRAEVDMEQAVGFRAQLRKAGRSGETVPSYNDMVVKACALALREHPRANAAYRDGAFELYERVNVGIAVAADDSLIVPTVFDADRKPLLDIAREARTLAERVRSRQITPAELSGGTFTVSNLGMFGVADFAAIINPPQAAILAVGELREVPVVRDGLVVPGSRMSIVLTCDHRILYGAPAAEFLARVRQLLEQPLNLLL